MKPLQSASSIKSAHYVNTIQPIPLRSARAELIAAFLLGGLIALMLAAPSKGGEPFRLDRLSIVRFSPTADGRLILQNGVLDLGGDVAWRGTQNIARPANTPEWALNRHLVNMNAWLAFHNLGGNSTANFEIRAGGVHIPIGDQVYMAVGVSPFAHTSSNGKARQYLDAHRVERRAGGSHGVRGRGSSPRRAHPRNRSEFGAV